MGLFERVVTFFKGSETNSPDQRPGRNDACWCGSGKKYKKCHLPEDDKKSASCSINCGPT